MAQRGTQVVVETGLYVSELEHRLRRGLPQARIEEVAGELRAHVEDATLDGISEAEVLRRFGTPRQYARRVVGSSYGDPVSRFGRRGAVAVGTTFLLLCFLAYQVWLPPMMQGAVRTLLWHARMLLCVPVTLFVLLAFLGKRAHSAFFMSCFLVCLLVAGVDGGTRWTANGEWSTLPKVFRTVEAELPVRPKPKTGEKLLQLGLQVYGASLPQVPTSLRVGTRFIVPVRPRERNYGFDEVTLFRQEPTRSAMDAIYEKYRDVYTLPDVGEESVRRLFVGGDKEDCEMDRLKSVQPYRTVATLAEATKRWRKDGPVITQAVQEEKLDREKRVAEYQARYAVMPVFSWEAAWTRCLCFCWLPLGLLIVEGVAAYLGRVLWKWGRNRGDRRTRAA